LNALIAEKIDSVSSLEGLKESMKIPLAYIYGKIGEI
jgi:hypothetical protein